MLHGREKLRKTIFYLSVILLFTLALPVSSRAAEIDWESIRPTTITLFYPGMTSMEFLISDDHRLGSRNIKKGKKNCRRCHLSKKGELDLKADEIANGTARMKRSAKPFEDRPIRGKKGVLLAVVQAAYDHDNIYLKLSWNSKGRGWKDMIKQGGTHPDRISFQLNKREDFFKRYGCFISCHNDLNSMPESPPAELVRANPYYSLIKRDDIRLYAFYTRDGGWDKLKSKEELSNIFKAGGLMDLWSVKIKGGSSETLDGWVFEDRRWEESSDIEATTQWTDSTEGGRYTIYIKRKLLTADKTDIQIHEGDQVSIAVAIHDNNTETRRHYVSFPMTIGVGAEGEIAAQRVP